MPAAQGGDHVCANACRPDKPDCRRLKGAFVSTDAVLMVVCSKQDEVAQPHPASPRQRSLPLNGTWSQPPVSPADWWTNRAPD